MADTTPLLSRRNTTALRDPAQAERDYTKAEEQFLHAVDQYKTVRGRRYPTLAELLAVLVSLGYRQTDPPGPLPRFHRGHVFSDGPATATAAP